jgi:hypothetical protein
VAVGPAGEGRPRSAPRRGRHRRRPRQSVVTGRRP